LVALSFTAPLTSDHRWAVAAAAGLFGIVGLVEDVAGVRALHRLAIQFAVAAFASTLLLDELIGPAVWRGIFVAGAVFWLVAFVNAYNFMDGIDGISVAQAVGAGATWFAVGSYTGTPVLAVGGAIIAGCGLGFAPFNVPKPRMFLGDVGSYFLGAWLAAVAILGLRAAVAPEAVLAPLALYVADTGVTLASRVARGERWYEPHRDHAYQRIGNYAWSHVRTSAVVAGCIGVCGLLGAVSLGNSVIARIAADMAIVGVIGGYLLAPRWLPYTRPGVEQA
jgi:UDP-GlcNAc:undecaprenyl-phosphate GlcNAc-1-phosphate transferase